MASGEKTVGFRADADQRERIQQYQDRRGLETQAATVETLVETGLKESQPIVSRAKDRVFEGAYYLGLVAIVVLVTSVTTELLTVFTGVQVATILIAVGVGGLAAVEAARLVSLHWPAVLRWGGV